MSEVPDPARSLVKAIRPTAPGNDAFALPAGSSATITARRTSRRAFTVDPFRGGVAAPAGCQDGRIIGRDRRGSDPPGERSPALTALQRSHRQAMIPELLPVELGLLLMPGPDDRLSGGVDAVRERHSVVVGDTGNHRRERKRDALERVVVVVQDDHVPRPAETRAFAGVEALLGANMTTLNFMLSRTVGRTLRAGDEILVTRLEHDANISPWLELAHDIGAKVGFVDIGDDTTLDYDDLERQLTDRTRIVAFTLASNAAGTLTDAKRISQLAHDAGALAWADGVHYAPHGPIDVGELGVDVLLCSPYKFFGPHLGLAFVRADLA